jgi:hypothetical protein
MTEVFSFQKESPQQSVLISKNRYFCDKLKKYF